MFFAVYSGSNTQVNISKRNSVTFVLFLPPAAYYIKGIAERVVQPRRLSRLRGQVLYKLKAVRVSRDYYRRAPIISTAKFEQSGVLPYYSQVYESLVKVMNAYQ